MYLKELNQPTYPLPLEIIDLYKHGFLLAGLSQRYAGLTSEPQRHDVMNEVASKACISKLERYQHSTWTNTEMIKNASLMPLQVIQISASLLCLMSGRVEQPGHTHGPL